MGKFLTTKVPTLPLVSETVDAVTGLPPSPPVRADGGAAKRSCRARDRPRHRPVSQLKEQGHARVCLSAAEVDFLCRRSVTGLGDNELVLSRRRDAGQREISRSVGRCRAHDGGIERTIGARNLEGHGGIGRGGAGYRPETLAGNPPRRTSTPDLTCPAASSIAVAPSAVALSGYQICMKPAPVNSSLYDPGARPKNA